MIRKNKQQQNMAPIIKPAEIKTINEFHKEVDRLLKVFDHAAANQKRRKEQLNA